MMKRDACVLCLPIFIYLYVVFEFYNFNGLIQISSSIKKKKEVPRCSREAENRGIERFELMNP